MSLGMEGGLHQVLDGEHSHPLSRLKVMKYKLP